MSVQQLTGKPEKDLVSIHKASEILQCHPDTLKKLDVSGVLPSLRIDAKGHRRFRKKDIDKLLLVKRLMTETPKESTPISSQINRTSEDLNAVLLALNETALVSETDASGTITYVNDKFVELTGYTRKELIGQNHRILKSGEQPPEFYSELWNTITQGKVWRKVVKNLAKDGSYFWVDTSIAPIMGKENKPVKYISVRFPVTKQKEFQEKLEKLNADLEERVQRRTEELRKSEEHFRVLTNTMPQLVWTATPDGVADYFNDKHNEYEGIKKKGKQWMPTVHQNEAERSKRAWQQAVDSSTTYEVEHRIKLKNGEYRWHLTRGIPLKDTEGTVTRWYVTATDIHEQKILEEQKDEFVGVVSHELKTPVTSIKAYTQVMKSLFKRKGDEKSVEFLQKMDAQLNKLTVLIADLLDVTKINSGKLQLRLDYFDFNELVEEIVEEMQLTTRKHQISKVLDRSRTIYGDRDRIGQAIVNFFSNAIKYSPQSDKIIIKTKVSKHDVTLCVQDFGVGIAKEKKDKVFGRFYRVGGDSRETYPGLGLGLYITSEIIRRHGGEIWVESDEGKGATFCFMLRAKGRKNRGKEIGDSKK